MAGDEWALGIDVGTSRSAGAMANGSVSPLEVEGNRWMPSMVLLDQNGVLVVGSAADYQAGVYPDRVERTPKRYLGGPAPLLLGDAAVAVEDAIARLIQVFIDEGKLRHDGRPPMATVLTHPVRWGDDRKNALMDSARRAGLADARLIEEPVAAAVHYVGDRVAVGEYVGVYDLGGGTFDTAVLRRTSEGFESVGAPGGDEFIGGEHFDHLIYEHLGEQLAEIDADLWEEIQYGEDRKWTRAAADLLTQARRAKEAVSSYPTTQVLLPLVDRDIVITRGQVEDMIQPMIEQTVDEMSATIESASLTPDDLAAIYLVGGSSRIPLVTELMTERFGDRIATRDEPKSVVALGAATVARRPPQPEPTTPAERHSTTPPPGTGPTAPPPGPKPSGTTPTIPPGTASRVSGTLPGDGRSGVHWTGGLRPGAHRPGEAIDARVAPASTPPPPVPSRLVRTWGLDLHSAVHGISSIGPSVYVTLADSTLHHLEVSGRWRWSTPLPGVAYGPAVPGPGTLHVGCANNLVTTLDANRGTVRWRVPARGSVVTPPVLAADVVVVADDQQMLAALAWRDGSLRWLLPLRTAVRAPITVVRSALLVAGLDGRVFRVEIASGKVTWAFPCPDPVKVRPVLAADQALIASTGGMVYAIDATTGKARWGTRVGGPVDGQLACWDRLVLAADRSGEVSAIDRGTGKVAWRVDTGGPNPTGVTVNRSVAVLDNGAGELVVIDLDGRTVKDRMKITSGAWQAPIVVDDTLVVPSGQAVIGVRITA